MRHTFNVSATTVHDWRQKGKLPAQKQEDGVWYFKRSDVAKLVKERGVTGVVANDGVLASRVFEDLARGRSPVDLVIELEIPPVKMQELVDAYNRMRAMRIVRAGESDVKCEKCHDAAARFCGACAGATATTRPATSA